MKTLIEGAIWWARGLVACLAVVVTGCNAAWGDTSAVNSPAGVSGEDRGDWETIVSGIERREIPLTGGRLRSRTMTVIRLDPQQVVLRVHYAPGAARALEAWHQALPEAQLLVNGAFFDENDRALGLIVSDGQAFGQTFTGFGGMLEVTAQGTRVRSLVMEPYRGEPLWQAIQAFPMLVEVGGVMAPQGAGFDENSRRTWVGHDQAGRILFGVTHALISLADLQTWLLSAGLDLQIAFALDGGRSSGMLITTSGHQEALLPLDTLPSVIAVYRR